MVGVCVVLFDIDVVREEGEQVLGIDSWPTAKHHMMSR